MTEAPCDRLKRLREDAGYASTASFAKAHDLTEPTYRSHENGTRPLTIRAAKQYASVLNVSWKYLMFGEDKEKHGKLSDIEFIAKELNPDRQARLLEFGKDLLAAQLAAQSASDKLPQ